VHLSRDRGQTWEKPLYTGLPEYFPYKILETSSLPLWAKDRLHVEVEIRDIGRVGPVMMPSPPPVSPDLKTGLYLDIPLAELARDTDADGIPDITEERLLLDPNSADSDRDGVTDGIDPTPNLKPSGPPLPEDEAVAAAIEIVSKPLGAIVSGFAQDKSTSEGVADAAKGIGRDAVSPDRPVILSAGAVDYSRLSPKRMILVYSSEDIARFSAMRPYFGGTHLHTAIFNRAGERGFMKWAAGGFTGGTLRVTREGSGWRIELLSAYII
jgi:hypothetical protein